MMKWGCRCQRSYHSLKCQLLFGFPYKWFIFLSEPCQWFRILRIFRNEPPVIIAKPHELLYLKKIIQTSILGLLFPAPIPYGLNLIPIHGNALCWYNQSQVSHCILMKFSFLWLEIQSCNQQPLHNPFDMTNMLLLGIAIYQHVIQICWCKVIQSFSNSIINITLKICWCIHCPKLH